MKHILLIVFLFPLSLNAATPLDSVEKISADSNHICIIDEENVKCWKIVTSDYIITKLVRISAPTFKNPRAVSTGAFNTCVLDDEGVKCWTLEYEGSHQPDGLVDLSNVPELKNPKSIFTGEYSACAVDDEGMKCWGSKLWEIPNLNSPRIIDVMYDKVCVFDGPEIKCSSNFRFPLPTLNNPRLVSLEPTFMCAIDDEDINCFGDNSFNQLHTPFLKNPIAISTTEQTACALDSDSRLKCWGSHREKEDVYQLKNSLAFTTFKTQNSSIACTIDDDGFSCFHESE